MGHFPVAVVEEGVVVAMLMMGLGKVGMDSEGGGGDELGDFEPRR
jgi:hypothetical protein